MTTTIPTDLSNALAGVTSFGASSAGAGWRRCTFLAGAIFGGIGGGMGGGGMAPVIGITVGALNLTPLILIGLIPAWFSGVLLTARTVYQKQTDKRARELEELADRLAQVTRELVR